MCYHHIIMDYIDIDLDNSQQIFYCELCEKTFYTDSIVYDIEKGKWVEIITSLCGGTTYNT